MKQCEFCGTNLPGDAGFCGNCGRISHQASEQGTYFGDVPTRHLEHDPDANIPTIALDRDAFIPSNNPASGPQRPLKLGSLEEEEDEEERRRRAALLGLGVPLLVNQAGPGHIPTMQGTPYMSHTPMMQGTPVMQGGGMPPSAPGQPPMTLPKQHGPHHHHHHPHHPPHPGKPPTQSTGGLSGCLTVSMIIIAAVVIIMASIVGLGLTVWAPNLALSGSSTVSPGGTLTLQGNHFLPNSSVTLTLDSGIPLLFSQRTASVQLADAHMQASQQAADIAQIVSTFRVPGVTNVISVNGNGSFAITITANASLALGPHVIHATESLSHRSASLPFTVGTPVTPTPTVTQTPTSTPTATFTPTVTPTPPILSCAAPGLLNLGPVSELSSQIAVGHITLCTGGTGTLTWNASWNQNQAPWLQLNAANGTIQAPNEASVTVNAVVANLPAGTYTTTLTFTGQESNTTQTVNVSLVVQTGCVNATPTQLSFSGVQNTSDPVSSQNISITNCGQTSNWSAKVSTASGGNWLSINPSQGTLNSGATSTITVTASNLKLGLKASRIPYQGTIAITVGSQTTNVTVSLFVQPAPFLSANPTSLDVNTSPCVHNQDNTISCPILLMDSSSSIPLKWTWTADAPGVTVQPNGGTITNVREQVTIVFSTSAPCRTITITFTGPGNSVNVTWTCQIIG